MGIRLIDELRFRAKRMLLPALLFFVLFYASYHILSGERGVVTWLKLSSQVSDLEKQNMALEERSDALENKTTRLKGDTLDPDYLDEQIRRNLPSVHPNEKVVFIEEEI